MSSISQQVEQMTNPAVAEEVKQPTKADKARTIFQANWPAILGGKVVRKDVIALLKKQAGLTAHGAATYYQNMVSKARDGKLKRAVVTPVESNETDEAAE